MDELMIKVDNVTKEYKLGQIGGTTLQDELQRLRAKLRHQEDPTKKIGAKDYNKGETFMALNGVSFEVKKGERVGIIGHNGAGKSTLLKLLSRVTAPTSGEIGLNGRITSMLEVGTGFHHELTGRENIYMNGAILGMTKKEIDAKIEDIIEFSECRQFIDTPVKRYSSGMYVKLAFSVAAHLDSEIMIMDEVLAVGDMAFQKKCLDKMNDVSRTEGRTILYVSHNMNTIRQLCDRVVVLDHGNVVFDGGVEEGIEVYMGFNRNKNSPIIQLDQLYREKHFENGAAKMTLLELEHENCIFHVGDTVSAKLHVNSSKECKNAKLELFFIADGSAVIVMETPAIITLHPGDNIIHFSLNLGDLAPVEYQIKMVLILPNPHTGSEYLDVLMEAFSLEIVFPPEVKRKSSKWPTRINGYFLSKKIDLLMTGES